MTDEQLARMRQLAADLDRGMSLNIPDRTALAAVLAEYDLAQRGREAAEYLMRGTKQALGLSEWPDRNSAPGTPMLLPQIAVALVSELKAERDALARFKTWTHARLDQAGIPAHPDGPHSKEGCRIGDRMDIFQGQRDEARASEARLLEACKSWAAFMDKMDAGLDPDDPIRKIREGYHGERVAKTKAAIAAAERKDK